MTEEDVRTHKRAQEMSTSPHANNHASRSASNIAIWRDAPSILLLLLLYTLQGIPMGLSGSVPFLLQSKVSYKDQAVFSLISLPFSLKLLWAPLVDSLHWPRVGRRKSWLVPVQLLVGCVMIWGAPIVETWATEPVQILSLTTFFLVLYFLMATQDIAVDGWALTMLSAQNVGLASTCNTIGQTLGFFIANVGFLALNDESVSNKYFRAQPASGGLVTLHSFMEFWGWVFILTTLWIWAFKREDATREHEAPGSIWETYKELVSVLRLRNVQKLCFVLLTCRAAFAVTDSATTLKLLEAGMPKEHLAMVTPILVLVGLIQPVVMGRWSSGPTPLSMFLYGYPMRMVVSVMFLLVVWYAEELYAEGVEKPWWCTTTYFLVFLTCAALLHEAGANMMFVSQMAFFARISDPAIGGTYMTLLNTIANFGSKWPNTLSLTLIDFFTVKTCEGPMAEIFDLDCSVDEGARECLSQGGACVQMMDGYDVLVLLGLVLGTMWLTLMWGFTQNLQRIPQKEWYVRSARSNE